MSRLERVECGLRNQLKEWERKYHELRGENQSLLEEKCELEEEENDSRLRAQRLDQQYRLSVENCELLTADLEMERKARMQLQREVGELRGRQSELRGEAAYLEALVQRYEQRVFDLEEVEVELREKLMLLEQACWAVAWANAQRRLLAAGGGGEDLRALPLLIAFEEQGTQTEVVDGGKESAVARLEGEVARLTEQAQESNERSVREIRELRDRLQSQEARYKEKIGVLESKVTHSREEDEDGADDGGAGDEKVNVLKSELCQLQAKEAAYSQTIQEADTILAKVESNYRETIADLQAETKSLRERLEVADGQEQIVKESLRTLGSEGESHRKLAEVLERLIETEKQVLELKERVYSLERNERELNLQLMKAREEGAEARAQLHEQEFLTSEACKLGREREEAVEELARLHGVEKKLLDAQQSEGFLRGRVEEMEATEAGLREGLDSAERQAAERERAWQDKVGSIEKDLREKDDEHARSQQDEASKRNALRLEVEGLSSRLGEVEKAAEAKGAEAEQMEASLRSEVSIPHSSNCLKAGGGSGSARKTRKVGDGGVSRGASSSSSSSSSSSKGGGSFCLARYRSIRDHTGRYFLVVKIS